ncbi:MAG TPA: hypothetical protein VED84_06095 [Acidimicrobiales bacterium]|nr:hypothetical protein [Acidimicrobiales bacterium]
MRKVGGRPTRPRTRTAGIALLVSATALATLGVNVLGDAASGARRAETNTFIVTGTYGGSLKMSDPAENCMIVRLPGTVTLELILKGKLSGLSWRTWTFLAVEPKTGTLTQNDLTPISQYSVGLVPVGNMMSSSTGFSARSGKITIGGRTGSATYKMVFNNGSGEPNDGTVIVSGRWNCTGVSSA